jgi:hypothetical protein
MATNAKTNGHSKNETTTVKKEVQKKLAQNATGKAPTPIVKAAPVNVSLDECIDRFEKIRGVANQRERLSKTLTELSRFNYNSSDSCTFSLKDVAGLEFKTTNTNLIKLIAGELQKTLEQRKAEIEKQLVGLMN